MKCSVPEISWHNRDPVLSLDVHHTSTNPCDIYKVATGGNDCHVVVWQVTLSAADPAAEAIADLSHHLKPVNVVRFAPTDEVLLASADDDGHIILWRRQSQPDIMCESLEESGARYREHYSIARTLRGHLQDVYDLCWSADGGCLVSGAVDNTAILWDVHKGVKLKILDAHESFVQGVAWDPLNKLVATLSCDRYLRVFSIQSGKCVSKVHRAKFPCKNEEGVEEDKPCRLFHDDTLQTFCRRLTFSPDGTLLLAPAGLLETGTEAPRASNVVHVFSRHDLSRPVFCLPSGDKYTIAVRCCPTLFKLRMRSAADPSRPLWEQTHTMLKLPYRMVVAVATRCSVLLYDTQQQLPFARISNIHFTRLTDVAWSRDGRLLTVSSTDGFCSLVTFDAGELGEVYRPDEKGAAGDAAPGEATPATEQSTAKARPAQHGTGTSGGPAQVSGTAQKQQGNEPAVIEVKRQLISNGTAGDGLPVTNKELAAKPTPIAVKRCVKPTPVVDAAKVEKKLASDDEPMCSVEAKPSVKPTPPPFPGAAKNTESAPVNTGERTAEPSTSAPTVLPSTPGREGAGTPRRVPLVTLSSPRRPVRQPPHRSPRPELEQEQEPMEQQDGSDDEADDGSDDLVLHLEETTRELDGAEAAPLPTSPPPRSASGPPPPSPQTPRRVPLVTLSSPKRRTPAKAD